MKIPGLDQLAAAVASISNAEQAAVKLVQSIPGLIRDALGEDGIDPDDAAAVTALTEQLESRASELAGAVVANTPAAKAPGAANDPAAADNGPNAA